jgi:hypothetical protein
MNNMQFHPQEATSERVKSHLQKFRLSRSKEKENFLEDYDKFLDEVEDSQDSSSPAAEFDGKICLDKALVGGQSAALLSHLVLKEECVDGARPSSFSPPSAPFGILEQAFFTHITNQSGYRPSARIPFPELSEHEKSSPLGKSLMHAMGLLGHMGEHLTSKRCRASPPNKEETAGYDAAADGEPAAMGSPHGSSPPGESLLHSFQQVRDPQTDRLKGQSSTAQAFFLEPPPSHLPPPHSLLRTTAQQGGERSLTTSVYPSRQLAVAAPQFLQLPAPLPAIRGGVLNEGLMGVLIGRLEADQAFAATLQALGGGAGQKYPLLPPPCMKLPMNGSSPPAPTSSATSSDLILHHRNYNTSRSSTPLCRLRTESFSHDDGFGEFYTVKGNLDALSWGL